jgi:hypothetical protein
MREGSLAARPGIRASSHGPLIVFLKRCIEHSASGQATETIRVAKRYMSATVLRTMPVSRCLSGSKGDQRRIQCVPGSRHQAARSKKEREPGALVVQVRGESFDVAAPQRVECKNLDRQRQVSEHGEIILQ